MERCLPYVVWLNLKKEPYLIVNVFSMKGLIKDTIFTWSSEPREGSATCSAKGVPSFLGYFKTLSIGRALGIEPPTFHSVNALTTELILPWQRQTLGVHYIDIVLFRGNCYSKEPKRVTTFDLFTLFCADFIQSEASWKLSSTSDWLMSAWKNVS